MSNNKQRKIIISFLLFFSLFSVACSNIKREPVSIKSIVAYLKSNGYKVEVRDPSKDVVVGTYFPLSSLKYLYINDGIEAIIINIFDNAEVAQQQVQIVSKDGYRGRHLFISGAILPIFFVKDNLIVSCPKVSSYAELLEKLLGRPVVE